MNRELNCPPPPQKKKTLRRNPPGNWVILIFSGQKPCNRIIYRILHSFLQFWGAKDVFCHLITPKKISHGSPRKCMSHFTRIVKTQVKFWKTMVRCHFMNFFFLELNINTHGFDLASWPKRSSKVSWSQLSDFSRTFSITEREMCTKKLTLISWKAYRLIYYSDLSPRWLDISLTSEKNSAVWLVLP